MLFMHINSNKIIIITVAEHACAMFWCKILVISRFATLCGEHVCQS